MATTKCISPGKIDMSITSSLHNAGSLPLKRSSDSSHRAHAAHVVQFYAEDSFLLDELSRFIGAALVGGDAAIVIATNAHRDELKHRLELRGLNASLAATEGRYISLDAAETLAQITVNGWPDAERFKAVIGSVMLQANMAAVGNAPRISAFGEMVALLWSQGKAAAAVHLEELWNDLARSFSFSLLCAYPMSGFDREDHGNLFRQICAVHSHVVPMESYTALVDDDQRSRSITHLQQKAQALETEMAERKRVEETLRRTQGELESLVEQRTSALQQLSARLLNLQDAERRRIARELHDSLGQSLVGLKFNVDMLKKFPDRDKLWSATEELMQQCIAEVRTLSYLLHPPTIDAAGFTSAARWYLDGFGQRSGLKVTLDAALDLGRLPEAIELALFRVLQEALTNVHRHSGASAADVRVLADAEQVLLEVQDNGHGIPQELLSRFQATGGGVGVGLAGIGERVRELGGQLKIKSDSEGTFVRVTIPRTTSEA